MPFLRFDHRMTSQEMSDYLLCDAKVALTPGTNYGSKGEGCLRICIATSEGIINEVIDRMEVSLSKLNTLLTP